jgi:hypothetical protein
MEGVRNIRLKLAEGDPEVPSEAFEQFREAAQHVADHGWDGNPNHGREKYPHNETYSDVCEAPSLQSSLVQSAATLDQHHSGTASSKMRRKPVHYRTGWANESIGPRLRDVERERSLSTDCIL